MGYNNQVPDDDRSATNIAEQEESPDSVEGAASRPKRFVPPPLSSLDKGPRNGFVPPPWDSLGKPAPSKKRFVPPPAISDEDFRRLAARDQAQAAGREMDAGNTGVTEALAEPVFGGTTDKTSLPQTTLTIAGAPFALLDGALPRLTPDERRQLAKTSPGWEKTEAGAELLGKIAPFLIPVGAAAEAAKGAGLLGKAAGAAFGAGAATQLPEVARQAGTVFGDPKSTAGERMLAAGDAGLTAGMAGLGLAGAAMPEKAPLPLQNFPRQTGAMLRLPDASEIPSRIGAKDLGRSDVPVGPPAPSRPVVPATPPEARGTRLPFRNCAGGDWIPKPKFRMPFRI